MRLEESFVKLYIFVEGLVTAVLMGIFFFKDLFISLNCMGFNLGGAWSRSPACVFSLTG